MLSRYSQQHARARPSWARGTCAVVRYRQNRSANQEVPAASAATRLESSAGNPLPAAAVAVAAHSRRNQPDDADVCAKGSPKGTGTAQQQQQQGRRGVPPDRATHVHGHPPKPQGGDHPSSSNFWVVVQHLEQQAAQEPTITAALLDTDVAVLPYPPPAAAAAAAAAQQQQRPNRLHLGRRHVQALDFDRMYRQLAEFKRAHLTAHVPRHCWDAPELGAWARQLRKDRKEGRLERWKVDRLNLLGFQWRLTEQDAKWHYAYHQLRRYKAIHGTTAIPADYSDRQEKDWGMVARWLEVQGRALAQRKLPLQHQHMVARLGVTLTVPRALVHRFARLQVTNAHERKLLRRAWRQHDQDKAAAEAAAAEAARAAALQQLQDKEQGLLLRQQLLQDSVQGPSTIPEHLQQELQRLQKVLQDLQQRQQQLQEKPVKRQSLWWQFRRLNPKLRRRLMLRLTSSSRRRMAPGAAAAAGSQQPLKPQLRQQQQQQQQQASKPGPVSYAPGIQGSSRWQWTGPSQGAVRRGMVNRQEAAAGVASAAAGIPIPVATAVERTAGGGQQQRTPAGRQKISRLRAKVAASGHAEVRQQRQQQQTRQQHKQQEQGQGQRQRQQQQQQQQLLPQVQGSNWPPTDSAAEYLEQATGSFAERNAHGAEQQGIDEGHLGQQQMSPEEVQVAESAESWSSSITTSSTSNRRSRGSAADTEVQPVSSEEPSSRNTGGEAPVPAPTGALYERWRSSARQRHSRQEMAQRVLEQQQVGPG